MLIGFIGTTSLGNTRNEDGGCTPNTSWRWKFVTELKDSQKLKIRIHPYQEQGAITFLSGAVSDLTKRYNVLVVPSSNDAGRLAKDISALIEIKTVPIVEFDPTLHHDYIVYIQPFNDLCNANDELKGKIKANANMKGIKEFKDIHNEIHNDKSCPYYQQNMRMKTSTKPMASSLSLPHWA